MFVIPALILIGLEVGLRAFGYGVPTGFTVVRKVDGQKRILNNPHFTRRFFRPRFARPTGPFSLPSEKANLAYRIFVLGGSAAQGTPDPAYGMTRMLDVMLRDMYPGVQFDVVNAAITATNSHVALPIARDCARLESDLFVIYLGNNEVIGPYGAGTVFSPLVSNLSVIRAGIALKATRMGQLMAGIARRAGGRGQKQPGKWGGMGMFLNHQVRVTDPAMETVYHHFEENLADICRTAQESGVPVIVSTVGSNLKDCSPFASLHDSRLSEADVQEWEEIVREGEALREQGRFEQAVERFRQAEGIDAGHAELHYRLGRCYWAMWDFRRAKESFVKARELDTLRFRADKRINGVIRRVSSGRSQEGIHLVDSLKTLEANSPEHTPGNELFYEHVHLSFRGTYLVAQGIFEQVQRVLPEWVSRHASGRAALSERECARRLAYTGWSRLTIARGLLKKMQEPPFSDKLYSGEQVDRLSEEVESLQAAYVRDEYKKEVLAQYEAALEGHEPHWRLHDHYADFQYDCLNNAHGAEKHLRMVVKLVPKSAMGLWRLGEVLSSQGKHAEAEEYYVRALANDPSTWTLSNLGMTLLRQGRPREAIRYLEEVIGIDPHSAEIHNNLGSAFAELDGAKAYRQAIRHLEKAIDIDPGFSQARENLAAVYAKEALALWSRKEGDRAKALFLQAIELAPGRATDRYNLAAILYRGGDNRAALEHVSRALEIDPNHENARKLLRLLRAAGD